jgi:tRNA(Ile)-lysidine synthase
LLPKSMPRSHPPTLITLVRAMLREHPLVARGTTVLAAVSGGPDSMALLHVLSLLRRERGFGLFAHGVDHGLRPAAAAELELAAELARNHDVPFERTCVSVDPGGNVQARARTARWRALEAAAGRAGASSIATGHHADDRAETMLMRILRGTSPRGLAVLPPRDGCRIRPLLRARRADIDAHIRRHRIPHAVDPSNRDPRFLRVRVRLEVLPLLERLNPRVVEHMYALADGLGVHTFSAPVASLAPDGPPDDVLDTLLTSPLTSPSAGEAPQPRPTRPAREPRSTPRRAQ